MRLIDADRLKEVFRRNTGHDYSELIDIQPTVDVLNKIKAEIVEYKDDKVIHYERNEMIDIVLGIIDKYRSEVSE